MSSIMNRTQLILASLVTSAWLLIGCGGGAEPDPTGAAAIDTVTYVGTPPTAAPLNHADTANVNSTPAAPVTFAGTASPEAAPIDRSDVAQPDRVPARFAGDGTQPTAARLVDPGTNVLPQAP
jgi:hypothetical protein